MIFLANRANLDKRTLLTRIHDHLQTQTGDETTPIEDVRYHTANGNKVGVRAAITPAQFLQTSYPNEAATLHVSFDFPPDYAYDFYQIQWIEPDRELMLGWHQDETHMDLGPCHFQLDHRTDTVQRTKAAVLDQHPLNVFDHRITQLVDVLTAVTWDTDHPTVPPQTVE